MKKKLLILLTTAVLVIGMIPVFASGVTTGLPDSIEIDEVILENVGGTIPDAEGETWSYSQGVLTLDGYQGQRIDIDGEGTITVLLKGDNVLTGALEGYEGGSFTITGSGSLTVNEGSDCISGIFSEGGTVSFQLNKGGKVTAYSSDYGSDLADVTGALRVFTKDEQDVMQASLDMITLGSGNVITEPAGGAIVLEVMEALPTEESSAPEATAPAAAAPAAELVDNAYATVKATPDGAPATKVVIVGTGEEVPPVPPADVTPAAPGTVTPAAKTPKTGDNGLAGLLALTMVAGAAVTIGLARKKFD